MRYIWLIDFCTLILQAPESMKSVVQALYLLTTAIGNLIDFVVAAILSGVKTKQVGFPFQGYVQYHNSD